MALAAVVSILALTVAMSGGKETLPVPEAVISESGGVAAWRVAVARASVTSRQMKVRFIIAKGPPLAGFPL